MRETRGVGYAINCTWRPTQNTQAIETNKKSISDKCWRSTYNEKNQQLDRLQLNAELASQCFGRQQFEFEGKNNQAMRVGLWIWIKDSATTEFMLIAIRSKLSWFLHLDNSRQTSAWIKRSHECPSKGNQIKSMRCDHDWKIREHEERMLGETRFGRHCCAGIGLIDRWRGWRCECKKIQRHHIDNRKRTKNEAFETHRIRMKIPSSPARKKQGDIRRFRCCVFWPIMILDSKGLLRNNSKQQTKWGRRAPKLASNDVRHSTEQMAVSAMPLLNVDTCEGWSKSWEQKIWQFCWWRHKRQEKSES